MLDDDVEKMVDTIAKVKSAGRIGKYIDFVQFPYYRNLAINTRINFTYPLTIFVGQNGCGKSSVLHALYGTVRGKTPYDFWFDTQVDPIQYYDDEKRRHSFWYSYKDNSGNAKEVVKARIKRENNPNYWETSRPLDWAGMSARNDGRRDSPIKKNVVYLDFRSELSAFDKFFYFGNVEGIKAKNKQEFIRRKSSSLRKIIQEEVEHINSSARELNKPLQKLTQPELDYISFILGRKYVSGNYVEHLLFRNSGYSILFQTDYATYSEAFAGSGEMAVFRLVNEVLKAPDESLILLDEPEVSLHPGAQRRLRLFLLDQIKRKKHQVVLTSHSPSLARDLPKEAIKVFYQNPKDGRFLVKENMLPTQAFFHIEFPVSDKKIITVEDSLAKDIIQKVLDKMGAETEALFNVKYNPGGSSVIKNEFATVYCREDNSKEYILLDGDQKIVDSHYNWQELPNDQVTIDVLRRKIKEQTNTDISFSVDGEDGSSNKDQQLNLLKRYLQYYKTNVFYLPKQIPEDIIWDEEKAKSILSNDYSQDDAADIMRRIKEQPVTKGKFSYLTEIILGSCDANDIASIHKLFIQSWSIREDGSFLKIRNIIEAILKNG